MIIRKDLSKMSVQEIEERLKKLWNRADYISHNSSEFDEIFEELLYIRNYVWANKIKIDQSIEARF